MFTGVLETESVFLRHVSIRAIYLSNQVDFSVVKIFFSAYVILWMCHILGHVLNLITLIFKSALSSFSFLCYWKANWRLWMLQTTFELPTVFVPTGKRYSRIDNDHRVRTFDVNRKLALDRHCIGILLGIHWYHTYFNLHVNKTGLFWGHWKNEIYTHLIE